MRPCGESMKTRMPAPAAHRVLGRRAGVARGGTEDIEILFLFFENRLEQTTKKL